MDWLRRNWPDLLIGIALVAVIAGIIATLITGGSFFPVGQSTRTSTPPAQSSTTQSSAAPAATSPSTASKSSTSATSASKPAAPANGASSKTQAAAPAKSSSSATSSTNGGGISVLPPGGNSTTASNASPSKASPSSATASSAKAPASAAAPASASQPAPAATTASAAPPASTSSATGPGAAAPYRISVGAFSHPAYAKRQQAVFQKAGYPVFLATQGDLTIVLVGPYRSQSEAQTVAAKIKNGNFGVDPVIYQFKGTHDTAPPPASSSAPAAPAPAPAATAAAHATSAAPAAAATATSASASASAGQRYLQVGAYDTAASAKPQVDRIQAMGFTVSERHEGGLVKLLIGPFGPSRLQQVASQLKAAGIDSFPR